MVSAALVLKRGDTGPAFRAQCLDGTTPVDVTGANGVRLLMRGPVNLALTLTRESGAQGWVRRSWGTADLAVAGVYKAEVEVTWADASVQTFPADGYAVIDVVQDLG